MPRDRNYGARLTDEEYELEIVRLHEGLPAMPTKQMDREVRRRELDLAIDHRLGRDFPVDRREALWEVRLRVEKARLRFAIKHLVRRIFARRLARDAQQLAGVAVDEYAEVLEPDELEHFFGLEPGARPSLPVDIDRLKK